MGTSIIVYTIKIKLKKVVFRNTMSVLRRNLHDLKDVTQGKVCSKVVLTTASELSVGANIRMGPFNLYHLLTKALKVSEHKMTERETTVL